jgi:hypothetical protein
MALSTTRMTLHATVRAASTATGTGPSYSRAGPGSYGATAFILPLAALFLPHF